MKFLPLILLSTAVTLQAEITLAPLFRDGAVLQQGKPVPVWGTASPGEKVEVQFGPQKKQTAADDSGKWHIELDPLSTSSAPAVMTIVGANTVKISDILVGEVWICSGQSNMAWPVERAKDFPQESAAANYPQIRQFKVPLKASDVPLNTVEGRWETCSPLTVGAFTATGYFFGRELHKTLGVPVGLINTSYGGTPIESWMSDAALRGNPAFNSVFDRWKQTLANYPEQAKAHEQLLEKWKSERAEAQASGQAFTKRPPRRPDGPGGRMTPSGLYNAMVIPLLPYAIRGVIWYQGEANAQRFPEYSDLFLAMIGQWRKDFGQGDVPFYFVQLANLERRADTTGTQWAFQREAQTSALRLPNTGMVVTADIGEANNIHPKNKQEVGRRLALNALALTYAKGGEYSGPTYRDTVVDGGTAKVSFDHANGLKLTATESGSFELAGSDRVFHPAEAKVDGNILLITSQSVKAPVSVRYAWKNNPAMAIYNGVNLPAPPFRSDSWPAVSSDAAEEETP